MLLNSPGITDPDEMGRLEPGLLEQLATLLVGEITAGQALITRDLRDWHYH